MCESSLTLTLTPCDTFTAGENHLSVTAEKADLVAAKKAKKEVGKASYGWSVFNQDALYKSHDKRIAKSIAADPVRGALQMSGGENVVTGEDVLKQMVRVSDDAKGLDRMVTELVEHEAAKSKFSRRRANLEAADIDYINDRNKHFNKKIGRAFDKYTVEIRQNLERGTAL